MPITPVCPLMLCFNSTLVRLEVAAVNKGVPLTAGFNSTLVRLEVLRLKTD